ncbi:cyclic nucleotide-binding domain-containing protein [Tellurirhabdus bombi]|uniref:cyclic nucleotide-binding domain-containing protein n=1 Tax=Tellurirhabdus bombi TaxID=2907205 RepID=UPI001F208D77|nr:cyclic nucleotide-binding domain-containing protein [Tellurirhabdus bombi]
MIGSPSSQRLQRSMGIRSTETQTVRLFFLHHFFLGLGTILVYVAANVILLENHPETSLPVAYVVAALAMMGMGKLYAYFEHHLSLQKLVVRVLWSVIILTGLIIGLVVFGHSVAMAIAIMVGYRAIYLLTNLEFWGISALVFDVRQSKRLFSVISSGDMPAKALGAVLAALIHGHSYLGLLLIIAFGFYGAALYTVRLTIHSHDVHAAHKPARPARRPQLRLVQQLFGGSELIFAMCLNVLFIAVVATIVEYAFFVNVKYKFHDQAVVMQYLGFILAITYLLAMVVKLVASHRTLDRFGILRTLRLLPIAALVIVVLYGVIAIGFPDETSLMIYYCGLYLVFEVVRRALFDPVFLVLFQPLPPQQRLKGHTLAKSFYEPLGMALGGIFIFLLRHIPQNIDWFLIGGIALASLAALWAVRRTYDQYVNSLHDALGRRFLTADQLALPDEATGLVIATLQSDVPEEVINSIDWLITYHPHALGHQTTHLWTHKNARVRHRLLEAYQTLSIPLPTEKVHILALHDPDPAVRELAAELIGNLTNASSYQQDLVSVPDLATRKGAIKGFLRNRPTYAPARNSLEALCNSSLLIEKLAALECIGSIGLTPYAAFVKACLQSDQVSLVTAALAATSALPLDEAPDLLLPFLTHKQHWRSAVRQLAAMGGQALPFLQANLQQSSDRLLVLRLITVGERLHLPEAQRLLVSLTEGPDLTIRLAALKALKEETSPVFSAVFEHLLDKEIRFAQRLLHGSNAQPDSALTHCLTYELQVLVQRVCYLLAQLYDRELVTAVRLSLTHLSAERRANSLELLENLIPRPVYTCLQVLTDPLPLADKVRLIDAQLDDFEDTTLIQSYIIQQGTTQFSDWTVAMALRQMFTHQVDDVKHLPAYINHDNPIIQENALDSLLQFRDKQPVLFATFITKNPAFNQLVMSHSAATSSTISATERVFILKNNVLFSQTPEAVLSSIAPIMKEITYSEGQEIFKKGELGTYMCIIFSGRVGIYDETQELAVFGKGDFFGELALLDAEPRSASAVAVSDTTLFRIDQDDFYDLMDEREEVMRNIIRILCGRIRQQNQKLRVMTSAA